MIFVWKYQIERQNFHNYLTVNLYTENKDISMKKPGIHLSIYI